MHGQADPSVRRHVWVRGRVQGVWFRESCRRVAIRHGVVGWVRNLADGRVEAVFEGDAPAVAALVAWCQEGSTDAVVDAVEELAEPPQGFSGFSVR
ncbi:MAG TPA: acylphosphatase [Acidimicrobiales bacterium]|nr:acylphosphatase [Acidimicrobiales bacterium]